MNIGRTALLVLAAALIPGGLILLVPAIYRRSMEAARKLAARIAASWHAMGRPAVGARGTETKSPPTLAGSIARVPLDDAQLRPAVSPP